MKKILILLGIIFLLSGCGSSQKWVKNDGDYSNLEKDEYECQLQRAQFQQGKGGLQNLGINIEGWKMMERCMRLRGYEWK